MIESNWRKYLGIGFFVLIFYNEKDEWGVQGVSKMSFQFIEYFLIFDLWVEIKKNALKWYPFSIHVSNFALLTPICLTQ